MSNTSVCCSHSYCTNRTTDPSGRCAGHPVVLDAGTLVRAADHDLMPAPHEKDEDCDVDPVTLTCRGCGVDRGGPCDLCGGRGFHRDGCPDSDATEGHGLLLVIEEAEDDFAILQADGELMREGLHRKEIPGAFAECIASLGATEPIIEEFDPTQCRECHDPTCDGCGADFDMEDEA